ncbi:HNH endonuclease [Pseudonocardia alaniniphila]|uniref:HNH endonuclease n=1 Tax=Pseudonocardia alaniniphila TaxID=75291 RepID=A0ABS9TUP4_9PSEU|nr:HNH endonuclease signature motif containing protein [Pseudonocardia alaniniphila]MCH6172280.1 HNH endonuclease [Pseudonocardia alaniniphila]
MEEESPPLPDPDGPDLDQYVRDTSTKTIYGFLYRRRENPPSMVEIRAWAANELGEAHSQIDRRVRDLRTFFDVPAERIDGEYRYALRGWNPKRTGLVGAPITRRVRAEVLAPGRCAQCGRTPLTHGIVLVVDHRVPQAWGGDNEIENLQPLCEDCNHGKKDFYSSHDAHAEEIKQAISHEEPHRRIGELLKAFRGAWVPGELIGIVASAVQYQEDWQKRLREIRTLGWVIRSEKRYNEGSRVRTYYRVESWEPWPTGSISAEIRRRERSNAARRSDDG